MSDPRPDSASTVDDSGRRTVIGASAPEPDAPATGRARAWCCDGSGVREIEPEQAVELAIAGAANVWLDLDGVGAERASALLKPLHIHPVAVDDVVSEMNRPKVDDYGDYLYVVVHSARWDGGDRPTLREVDVLIGEHFLVTYHEGATRSISAAVELLPKRPDLLARGPAHLLHFLLDVLVDGYLPVIDSIADQIDTLEEEVVRGTSKRVHVSILRLKRGMSAMRRIVGPQRDALLALTRDEFRAIPAEMRPYLRDVYDRLARMTDLMDSFRDELAGLLDLQMTQVSNRLNQVMKILTVISTVVLPLTLVTGYYGMNVKIAAFQWTYGEPFVLALLILTAAGTLWYLRRRDWL